MIQSLVYAKLYRGKFLARCGSGEEATRGASIRDEASAAIVAAQKWFKRHHRLTGSVCVTHLHHASGKWTHTFVATIDPTEGTR